MFQHSSRGTFVWLLIVGTALVLTLLAGAVPTSVGAALLATYLGLWLMVARNIDVSDYFESWRAHTQPAVEPTEVAREAIARARSDPNYDSLVRLLDVGLIVDEQRPDGMALRRGRFISLDDDAIRPFGIIHVPDVLGGRLSHIRFELLDSAGTLCYVYEDEKWLEAGENPLLPDYRFPIRKKAGELEAGGWSARLIVDGGVIGVHHFNLSPALRDRRRNIGSDGEILRERVWRSGQEDESLPLSLEELLRQQSRQQHQN
ncbi:MAG: hypothetical protein JXA10_17735 [Anaerolineae bacterium]|nr:hypothetical protein [Anaerolineae bacterium]